MKKKLASSIIAGFFAILAGYIAITAYHCSGGWLCDLPGEIVAIPWSKLWDEQVVAAGGVQTVLDTLGVLLNATIIYFISLGILTLIQKAFSKFNGRQ